MVQTWYNILMKFLSIWYKLLMSCSILYNLLLTFYQYGTTFYWIFTHIWYHNVPYVSICQLIGNVATPQFSNGLLVDDDFPKLPGLGERVSATFSTLMTRDEVASIQGLTDASRTKNTDRIFLAGFSLELRKSPTGSTATCRIHIILSGTASKQASFGVMIRGLPCCEGWATQACCSLLVVESWSQRKHPWLFLLR